MTSKAVRQAVAGYHEARLAELVERAGEGIDRFRSGELDAFETDRVLFQFNRASKELWKLLAVGRRACSRDDRFGRAGRLVGAWRATSALTGGMARSRTAAGPQQPGTLRD